MNKNFTLDYIVHKLVLILGVLFSHIPPCLYIWTGKMFGKMMFHLDKKHREIVSRNIRFVLSDRKTPYQIERLTQKAFEAFAQNLAETIALRRIDVGYINKYLRIEGTHFVDQALKKKKGLIFVTLHLGSWELANAACGLLYESCSVIVKKQKHNKLNQLLNSYRKNFGVNLVELDALRSIMRALENNEIVSVVSDHGAGKGDMFVDFFGRKAPMPAGAVKLALKFKTPLIFVYIVRTKGPYHKAVLEPFDNFRDSGNKNKDLDYNLELINEKFEQYICTYPEQYLWTYKRWRYSKERSVIILSDGKVGHLRQSEALAKTIESLGYQISLKTIRINFKNRFSPILLASSFFVLGVRRTYLYFLKYVVTRDCYSQISRNFADIVVSSGSSSALVNILVSRQNRAKSVHIMRPGIFSVKRFNLVVMPRHDNPPKYKNVVTIEGALNLIDKTHLKNQSRQLLKIYPNLKKAKLNIGLLLGGDTKHYKLTSSIVRLILGQVKRAASDLKINILCTTSRRTSENTEKVVRKELETNPGCKLLIVASKKNIDSAVGGILDLSSVVVVTSESISMISEAASSGKFVIVLRSQNLSRRHKRFLINLDKAGYIYLTDQEQLGSKIKRILTENPAINTISDRDIIRKRLEELV